MKTAILIPTYNESENIIALITEIDRQGLGEDVEIIVIDDASPDGTGKLADDLSRRMSHVTCIHRSGKLGLGSAYRTGFQEALQRGCEAVVTMDADFSHHPRYLPALLQAAVRADVVIGSRYVEGGGQRGCTFVRQMLSRGANAFARILLRIRAHDTTAGFRCYRSSVFSRIDPQQVKSEGYSFLIEMLTYCSRMNITMEEVPIIFENRTRGASKISRGEIFQALRTVFRLAFRSSRRA